MKINKNNHRTIINLYNSGQTLSEISKKFNITLQGISYILKKYNIKMRSNKDYRNYRLNINFFENIDTPEKAIILGFICADGHNNMKKGQVKIVIHRDDINYLKEINKFIQPDKVNPIAFEYNKKYNLDDKRGKNASLSIYCKKICDDLFKLGLTPNKSLTLDFPEIKENLLPSFILGYFDGDGGVWYSTRRNKRDYIACFAVSDSFGKKLQNIIIEKISINCQLRKLGKISEIIISGNNQVEKFLDWIYLNSQIRLERKYKIYIEMKKYLDEYGRQTRNNPHIISALPTLF